MAHWWYVNKKSYCHLQIHSDYTSHKTLEVDTSPECLKMHSPRIPAGGREAESVRVCELEPKACVRGGWRFLGLAGLQDTEEERLPDLSGRAGPQSAKEWGCPRNGRLQMTKTFQLDICSLRHTLQSTLHMELYILGHNPPKEGPFPLPSLTHCRCT